MIYKNNSEKGAIPHLSLFAVAGLLVAVFAYNIVDSQNSNSTTVLGEHEASVESGDSASEASTTSSEESVNEESIVSVEEESTVSVDSVVSEVSTISVENEEDQVSTLSVPSEPSVASEPSEVSVVSEESISDFSNVTVLDENTSLVSNRERLFFIIPVDIEKTVSLDEEGNIVEVRQTLISRLLELLSF